MTGFAERAFVWCGGAVFVGALSLTGWAYAVWFGEGGALGGWTPLAVDALLLSLFALHHSAFAREPLKEALARVIPARLLRSVYVWVASLLLALVCVLWWPVGGEVYRATGWLAGPFALAEIAGILFIAGSVRAISPLELAGIRAFTASDDELQSHGVYGVVRHPLYFGWVLLVFGAAHLTGDRLAFAVLTTTYLLIAIPWEERSLERTFGLKYQRYKDKVRWRILPFVY